MGKNKTSGFNILFNIGTLLTSRSLVLYFRCPHVLALGYMYEYYCYGAHLSSAAPRGALPSAMSPAKLPPGYQCLSWVLAVGVGMSKNWPRQVLNHSTVQKNWPRQVLNHSPVYAPLKRQGVLEV